MELSPKTFIFAILLILILGLGYIVFFYKSINPQNVESLIDKYMPVSSKPASLILNLNAPNDNSLVFDNTMLVSGTTNPNCLVIVADQSFDHIIHSNDQGNFSDTITLDSGVNELTITAFDQNGNTKSNIKTVYFSKTKI